MAPSLFKLLKSELLPHIDLTTTPKAVKKHREALQIRWANEQAFEQGLNQALKKEDWRVKHTPNALWSKSPFGTLENHVQENTITLLKERVDFRGFPLRWGLNYHHLQGIDFSFLNISNKPNNSGSAVAGLINSVFEDCYFDYAELPQNLSEQFLHCSFQHALLQESVINADFNHCSFIGANLSKSSTKGNVFSACDFTNARFNKVSFSFSKFEMCNFGQTNFSNANISSCIFIGNHPSQKQLDQCLLKENIKLV